MCNSNLIDIIQNGLLLVPQVVPRIHDNSFKDCNALTSIYFEADSECLSIGNNAFEDVTTLEEVVIPASITQISNTSFSGVHNFTVYIEYGSNLNYTLGKLGQSCPQFTMCVI